MLATWPGGGRQVSQRSKCKDYESREAEAKKEGEGIMERIDLEELFKMDCAVTRSELINKQLQLSQAQSLERIADALEVFSKNDAIKAILDAAWRNTT